ncbi:MAG TPA: restriction endonuclease [Candidatus Angelobacter sp.]|jgi:hypothetical protein
MEKLRREAEEEAQWQNLLPKFYEIAERKIFIDEYGIENWDSVLKEMKKVLLKIAERNGESPRTIASIKNLFLIGAPVTGIPFSYVSRYSQMESGFRQYHESHKARGKDLDFNAQSGTEFETHLAGVLKQEGFEDICGTPKTGDQGADLIVKKNGRKIAIQAKRYKGSVGNQAVQEIVAAVKFYGADEGWVITSGTFTPSAKALAQRNGVRLIDGVALKRREFACLS